MTNLISRPFETNFSKKLDIVKKDGTTPKTTTRTRILLGLLFYVMQLKCTNNMYHGVIGLFVSKERRIDFIYN